MNEWGIDTAFDYNFLTQTAVDNLDFAINRITDLGALGSGTNAYYNKTFTPDATCYPNMKLVQTDNNKPAGMYFFSHAWNAASAAFEANKCCDWLDTWNFTPRLGVFLDFERLGASGRVGAFENLIYILGGYPSASLMQSIVSSWCTTIVSRGYKPGIYMNGDPINAITNTWLQTNRFNTALGSPYFWLAQWDISTPSWDCDIWQYYAGNGSGVTWQGITVDYDKVMNDRVFGDNPPVPSSKIPIWLMLKMARGENNGKHTILL